MQTYDVFISYRRIGGFELAEVFYKQLTNMGYKVFLDVESPRSGKFDETLLPLIKECTDVLLVLSPKALDELPDKDDWVRREITYAIEEKKNIIPVYMNGFVMPDTLPLKMKDLPSYTAIISYMRTFDQTFAKIVSVLHSKSTVQTNAHFAQSASWVNHNVLLWRIIFFPIAALLSFELCMILPIDLLQESKSQMHERNFAICRMIYLVLSSTLVGCALWIISKAAKKKTSRFLLNIGSITAICYLSKTVVNQEVWNGLYELWNTPLGIALFIMPWLITGAAILCTFIVRLLFVYFFGIA